MIASGRNSESYSVLEREGVQEGLSTPDYLLTPTRPLSAILVSLSRAFVAVEMTWQL